MDSEWSDVYKRQIMHGFNMRYSATHSEALKSKADGKYYFIETSARVGGAHLAEMVEAATGLNLWEEWAKVEFANALGQLYKTPPINSDHAGIIISLTKQLKPDYTHFNDREVVWKMEGLEHHLGVIVKSNDRNKLLQILDKYAAIIQDEFHATAPAPDKPCLLYTSRCV